MNIYVISIIQKNTYSTDKKLLLDRGTSVRARSPAIPETIAVMVEESSHMATFCQRKYGSSSYRHCMKISIPDKIKSQISSCVHFLRYVTSFTYNVYSSPFYIYIHKQNTSEKKKENTFLLMKVNFTALQIRNRLVGKTTLI